MPDIVVTKSRTMATIEPTTPLGKSSLHLLCAFEGVIMTIQREYLDEVIKLLQENNLVVEELN